MIMLQFNNSLLILVLFSTFLHESAEYSSSFCLKMDWPPYPLWRHIRHYGKRSRTGKNTSENKLMNHQLLKQRVSVSCSKSSGKNPRKPHEDGISPHPPAALFKLPLQILSQQCQSLNEVLEHLQPASNELTSRISEHPLFFFNVNELVPSWKPY